MNQSQCAKTAYELIGAGNTAQAIAFCESVPCRDVADCQRYLGWLYYQINNLEMALTWFTRAADQGDINALYGIACTHFVNRDFQLALEYYSKAADRGYSAAYHWIGYIYDRGLGTPRNADKASENYSKGAAAGYLIAERALLRLRWSRAAVWRRIAMLPSYLALLVKTVAVASRDTGDPRLVDIPNALEKKVGDREK